MKHRKRQSQALGKSEQLSLLKQPNPKTPTGLRNLCLISLMLKTGIKAAEVIRLREDEINWDNGQLLIRESGGAKERCLVIDDVELSLLKSWRRLKPKSSSLLFTTLKGESLNDRYLREMIKRYAMKAGIDKDVYPHLLRMTFALEFLNVTRDIERLQEALGHRDQSTTDQYLRHYFIEFSGSKDQPQSGQNIFADLISQQETKQTATGYADPENPYISIFAEEAHQERLTIPAMKCCRCNFILHYQGDCPQCGTAFAVILKHWGKSM